ncbi:MAG: NAD(+) synthase, partial [Thaumarchaeota archaeon]|nr:NAD(+) synthase [Nitrososphaerota archaeon]
MLIDKITDLDYGKIRQKIILFMKSELRSSKRNGFVIGLSGGLDSSVVVKLASEAVGSKLLVLILPSTKMTPVEDINDAITLSKKLNIKYNILDLEQVHSTLVRGILPRKLAGGNLLARLRMCMLYYYANRDNLMVMGTSNRSELLIGYFTKYGDGGVDILPIASLYKVQVKSLGSYLKLPDSILTKNIGPRLWAGHTVEKETGMVYEEIDSILYCMF